MGCVAFHEAPHSSPSKSPEEFHSRKDSTSTTPQTKPKFLGVLEKPTLLVRDQFHSKYDGSLMHKWRRVDVINVDEEDHSKIFVHFQGWADTFDQWIDLHTEIDKVAPLLLLSKAQCSTGKALTEEELRITRHYLLTGDFQPPSLTARPITTNPRDEVMTSPAVILPMEFFVEGKLLDILDIFTPLNSTEQKKKWRKARIIHVDGRRIRITYIGWDAKFDETLDIYDNADRISPLGTKTTEQSARSLSALKESPQKRPRRHRNNSGGGSADGGDETSDDEEDDDNDEEDDHGDDAEGAALEDASIANATTATTNSGGLLQSFARFMSSSSDVSRGTKGPGTSSTTNTTAAAASVGTASHHQPRKKPTSSGSSVASERTTKSGTNKRKKKGKHGKYASYEEARDEIMKKTAEEMAAELEKERKFLEALGKKKLHVIEVEGDGNCLFRAISHQLYLTEDNHEVLRRKCVEHLIAHKQRFSLFCADDYDEHVREMAKSCSWGDELEIRALEEILDRHITIYSSEATKLDEPINTNIEEEAVLRGVVPIMLSYHGQNHYNSIYDEKFPLPLPLRGTSLLLQSRMGLLDASKASSSSSSSGPVGAATTNTTAATSLSSSSIGTTTGGGTTGPSTSTTTNGTGNGLSSRQSLSRTSSGTAASFDVNGSGRPNSSGHHAVPVMGPAGAPPGYYPAPMPSPYAYQPAPPPMMMYPTPAPAGVMPMMPMMPASPYTGYSMPGAAPAPMSYHHAMPTMYAPSAAAPMMGMGGGEGVAGKGPGSNSARSSFGSVGGGNNNNNNSNSNMVGGNGGTAPGGSPARPPLGSSSSNGPSNSARKNSSRPSSGYYG